MKGNVVVIDLPSILKCGYIGEMEHLLVGMAYDQGLEIVVYGRDNPISDAVALGTLTYDRIEYDKMEIGDISFVMGNRAYDSWSGNYVVEIHDKL